MAADGGAVQGVGEPYSAFLLQADVQQHPVAFSEKRQEHLVAVLQPVLQRLQELVLQGGVGILQGREFVGLRG